MTQAATRTLGATTTTEEVLGDTDLSGRTAIVTGASGGLGAETARALASRGCEVTITARDVSKGETVAASIRAAHPEAAVEVRALELSDPKSVEEFADGWLKDHDALHLLIENAGVMACPLARNERGWEMQFATNHLGHFQLAARLEGALRAGAPSRLVVLSSGGHAIAGVDFDDIHFERRDYDPWVSYGQAKSANVLFAVEFDRRYRDRGVRAFAVHPGVIFTELARHLTPEMIQDVMARTKEGGHAPKPVEAGAATSVWAATAPELEGRGGLYLSDCQVGAPADEASAPALGYAPHAVAPDAASTLWRVSEETLGLQFERA